MAGSAARSSTPAANAARNPCFIAIYSPIRICGPCYRATDTVSNKGRCMHFELTVLILSGASIVMAQQPAAPQRGPQQPMTFFVTSAGSGDGANLGGLGGAD